jgi:hypothetical protein
MSLSDLASIGSFISGFAVLVSLIFLYFQLRQISAQVLQAERNQQAANRAVRTSRIVEILMGTADPSIADTLAMGNVGSPNITDTQIRQYFAYNAARFYNAQDTFQQFQQGLLDDTTFESLAGGLKVSLTQPGTLAFFDSRHSGFSDEFVKFVRKLASDVSINLSDETARWRTDVLALRSRVLE